MYIYAAAMSANILDSTSHSKSQVTAAVFSLAGQAHDALSWVRSDAPKHCFVARTFRSSLPPSHILLFSHIYIAKAILTVIGEAPRRMVRSILKTQSPQSSPSPLPPLSLSKLRHPRLSSPPPPLPLPSPHVHFPPTPTIVSSTYIAHSSSIYDRAPIEVSPNSCALPERGGRVLHAGSPPICVKGGKTDHPRHDHDHDEQKGSYFHPFAYEVCEPEDIPSPSSVPQLIQDSYSSSSESDESTESDTGEYRSPHFSPIPVLHAITPTAMSFLPHAGPKKRLGLGLDGLGKASRPKLNRRKTPVTGLYYSGKVASASIEEPPSLDGCLGGF
ncbi:hypothetical protein E1B28_001987 [Marasmius oreades]|uniref:Uncharacterized protein n=1 Tax=Marasmius oreades TaxID=181124 RepID=A0A9P8AG04_9AGAR|nr:uncharacterized protein E1B28_001987 [Marasmius oreades]KAG7100212.1 hypothetical protein E1B28_001987 [Marasmius oreades]